METIDKLKRSTSCGRSTENHPDQILQLCRRMIVQALRDTYDNSESVSFEAASYFASGDHSFVCDKLNLDHDKLRDEVIEALRLGGVKKQRMIGDIIEGLENDFKGVS